MAENPLTLEEVQEKIKAAFAGTQKPGDSDIIECHCGECSDILRDFGGRAWTDVSQETLEYHAAGLQLLAPAAYRYYLQAYLLAALEGLSKGNDTALHDYLIFSLSTWEYYTRPNVAGGYFDQVSAFSQDQREAITLFLWFSSQENPNDDQDIILALDSLYDVWYFTKPPQEIEP